MRPGSGLREHPLCDRLPPETGCLGRAILEGVEEPKRFLVELLVFSGRCCLV